MGGSRRLYCIDRCLGIQGELLIVSDINQDMMQKDRYEQCRELSYDYVLDIYPVNIRLRVEKMGEN